VADAAAVTRFFYYHADPNRQIAALAPAILALAAAGDPTAAQLLSASCEELLALAGAVTAKLFPRAAVEALAAGLSGPVLTHPVVIATLRARSALKLTPVEGTPIEGVRRLLMRA
jgi:glucosamine kinase